jgi:hypothetical protein
MSCVQDMLGKSNREQVNCTDIRRDVEIGSLTIDQHQDRVIACEDSG